MSAGNGKQLRKVFYCKYNYEIRADVKVSEPSRSERNRSIRFGNNSMKGDK
jgi:hypothetical protein